MAAIMTGREHLQMYAKLRGIPEAAATSMSQQLLDDLNLVPVADKVCRPRGSSRLTSRWQGLTAAVTSGD